MRTCFAGIERVEDTESKMEDHKSGGGAAGVDGCDSSIVTRRISEINKF